jgi:hypothetical protein
VPGYCARLLAIAGSSDNDIWAVGWFLENNSRHNLTLHWNGSAWERIPVPDVVNVGDNSVNGLYGVAAIAPNDVWAVGYAVSLSTPYQTVTLHWNGSAWQVVPSPNLTRPGSYNALNGVVAISRTMSGQSVAHRPIWASTVAHCSCIGTVQRGSFFPNPLKWSTGTRLPALV